MDSGEGGSSHSQDVRSSMATMILLALPITTWSFGLIGVSLVVFTKYSLSFNVLSISASSSLALTDDLLERLLELSSDLMMLSSISWLERRFLCSTTASECCFCIEAARSLAFPVVMSLNI